MMKGREIKAWWNAGFSENNVDLFVGINNTDIKNKNYSQFDLLS